MPQQVHWVKETVELVSIATSFESFYRQVCNSLLLCLRSPRRKRDRRPPVERREKCERRGGERLIKMTSDNQGGERLGHQNGHASPEIHLRGALPHTADEAQEMEDHVEDATSKAEDHEELDGLLEVCT